MLSLLALVTAQSTIETPYKQAEKLVIRSVAPLTESVGRFDMAEFEIDLSATYNNPFDSSDISVDMVITDPDRKQIQVPGFLYRDYSRKLENEAESLSPKASPKWRVRFTPTKAGAYAYTVQAKDRTGTARTEPKILQVADQAARGFVRVSGKDHRYFAFDDGTSFWPLGPNLSWAGLRGTFDYDDWLPKLADQGANYSRLWLSPSWTTFALEQPGKPSEGKGLGQFDLGNAWRLDYVLSLAQQKGMYLMLCIDSYNILRPRDAHPWWEKTPHNMDNGGPLRVPRDFWSHPTMEKLYKDKLRYLVARYGAYTSTMSWEFWNEVDLTDDFNPDRTSEWHRKMAAYLRSIDPYRHLITTSAASTSGFRQLDLLPELDYYQTHHYGVDPALTVLVQQSRKAGMGRPHYVGEIGADAAGPRTEDDPTGIQVHDPLWASIASGSSGNASAWWWDNLIAAKDLYSIYGAAHRFIADVQWDQENFRQKTPSFTWQSKPATKPMKDLEFIGGPVEWKASPFNRRRKVSIQNGKASGELPLAGILHGTGNHPDWHNPVTFDVVLPRPTRFEVEIGDVSGHGGAALAVSLDGNRVMTRTFPDPDGTEKTETLKQYAGKHGFTVPAGRHTIVVANPGTDWAMASFRFVGLVPRTTPEVQGWSVLGDTKVLAWIRREGRSWQRAISSQPSAAPPTVMALTGLASGAWQVEIWDTWEGKPLSTHPLRIGIDGKARVNLPSFKGDVAVKLSKQ